MMYASKIEIKRDAQIIPYHKTIDLPDGWLTLEMLKTHVTDKDEFSINDIDVGYFGTQTVLTIKAERLETDAERDLRVSKEVAYMENYYKHHEKYPKNSLTDEV